MGIGWMGRDEKCGIKHGFHDGTCIREKIHDGYCRCKAERMGGGSLMYSEWKSREGKFYSHVGYRTIYPKNAVAVVGSVGQVPEQEPNGMNND